MDDQKVADGSNHMRSDTHGQMDFPMVSLETGERLQSV